MPHELFEKLVAHYGRRFTFRCNCCGSTVPDYDFFGFDVIERELSNCPYCQSTVRHRTVVHLLSLALFGRSLAIPEMPKRKAIIGVGLTDEKSYAEGLAEKFDYINTYFHQEPKLDIAGDVSPWYEKCDFLISSEVFEHVLPPIQVAFSNCFRMLRHGGTLILTVPFFLDGETNEHFPDARSISTLQHNNEWIAIVKNSSGEFSVRRDIVFHGGAGTTLEMRHFSKGGLARNLETAGFRDIKFMGEDWPPFGVFHPYPWSRPLTARKQSFQEMRATGGRSQ